MESNSPPASQGLEAAVEGWVDLETASNHIARHWGLGPEHAQCFRTMAHCTAECNNLHVAMSTIHELHHQFLEKFSQPLGISIRKAINPHADTRDGPYAAVLADGRLLAFDDYLLIGYWLKAEKERQAIAQAAGLASPARARLGLRL